METYHILITLGILSLAVEIFTLTFLFSSVSVGLFLAAFGNYFEYSTENQIYLFSIGVIVSFFAIRPLFNKIAYNTNDKKTNKDNMINKLGVVIKKVGDEFNPGLVKIDGDMWKAITTENEIKENSRVRIIEINSIILTVVEIK